MMVERRGSGRTVQDGRVVWVGWGGSMRARGSTGGSAWVGDSMGGSAWVVCGQAAARHMCGPVCGAPMQIVVFCTRLIIVI
jgi:hypothetical protein